MVIQLWVLVEQTDHRTDHPQLTATAATRCDPTQQDTGVRTSPQQQPCCQTRHDQQRYGKQGKQARPGSDLLDACLGKAQPPCASRKPASQPGRCAYSATACSAV